MTFRSSREHSPVWAPVSRSCSSSHTRCFNRTAKAVQDEDVAVELRHGPDNLFEKDLVELRRGLGLGRSLKRLALAASALSSAFIADQIEGDLQQERFWMADVRHGVRRRPEVGLLDDIRRSVGADVRAQPAIQPDGVSPVETVDPVLRLHPQLLRIGHHGSPTSRREGRESRRGRAIPGRRADARAQMAATGRRTERQPSMI